MQISFRLEENLIQRTTVNQAGTYDMMRHHLYKNIKFTINKKRRKKKKRNDHKPAVGLYPQYL